MGAVSGPTIIKSELWERACKAVAERGRGRGKKGQAIFALLRNRIICPRCTKPMVVRRGGRDRRVYYHCSRYFKHWVDQPCSYRGFIPGNWDEYVWEDLCSILRDDALVFEQLASEQVQEENTEKLIRLQRYKISRAKFGIAKVQEGFEGELYDLNQAKEKISRYRLTIADAEKVIEQLSEASPLQFDQDALLEELKGLRDRNLDEATFEEKEDLISRLGIMVYPSEDKKSMKVICHLGPVDRGPNSTPESGESIVTIQAEREHSEECGIVPSGPPEGTRT